MKHIHINLGSFSRLRLNLCKRTLFELPFTAALLLTIGLCQTSPVFAEVNLAPSSVFTQLGSARGTKTFTLGVTWDLPYQWAIAGGTMTSYLEASYSNWQIRSRDQVGRSELSQLSLIPVLRYTPDRGVSRWFFEAGLGLSATSSIYHTREKTFSTLLNFGTHVAAGRSFGARNEHELSLRIEHFSNAGIKHPNPGENFVQVRYAYRF